MNIETVIQLTRESAELKVLGFCPKCKTVEVEYQKKGKVHRSYFRQKNLTILDEDVSPLENKSAA
ncbi:MAG: hypothetical protein KGI50_07570 [Patescibacteria group bacterium]|nr:hypothetical protein [Patescibacteria group bacterium]MDE2438964.1 hypothetical protein [Patescibacteria group bacterium]